MNQKVENNFNHIEDFLTDESFRNWVKNPTPELDHFWNSWLKQSTEKQALVSQAKSVILSMKFKEFNATSDSKAILLQKIKLESSRKMKSEQRLTLFYKVAAILFVSFGLSYLVFHYLRQNPNSIAFNERVKENKIGEKSKIMLSDGTVVFLNSNSSLSYPPAFESNERIVQLKGEAYFDVASNPERPFIVTTEALDILVLGTEFNVKTNSSQFEVALVEGHVRIVSENQTKMKMEAGQQVNYDLKNQLFAYTTFDKKMVTGWKDGILIFQNASFNQVITSLHEWFGIEIAVKNPTLNSNWTYTATFDNESLESVLQNMSALRQFDYTIKNDTLILSFK